MLTVFNSDETKASDALLMKAWDLKRFHTLTSSPPPITPRLSFKQVPPSPLRPPIVGIRSHNRIDLSSVSLSECPGLTTLTLHGSNSQRTVGKRLFSREFSSERCSMVC